MKRVAGLDSLRFIMAFIVLLSHGAVPDTGIRIIDAILGNSFVGIAAVIVFFLLSGFVIHYPYSSNEKEIKIGEFYLKRISRIAIPAVIAFVIFDFFNVFMWVVWSLICEVIYYFLYPLFLKNIKKINIIILVSFLLSYLVSIQYTLTTDFYDGNFQRHGFWITWIIGLPAWLLGVKLANSYICFEKEKLKISFVKLNIFRGIIYLLAFTSSVLRFHFDIAFSYSLPIFSLVAYFWLKYELIFYMDKKENKILVYLGGISYSIYLIHALVKNKIVEFFGVKSLGSDLYLCIFSILSSLILSWFFYLIVEKPSHNFSRSIKLKFKKS
jgi:peptidoglycan/LPS O-acetylase OafA/YrhL